jgi:hypothetical protein
MRRLLLCLGLLLLAGPAAGQHKGHAAAKAPEAFTATPAFAPDGALWLVRADADKVEVVRSTDLGRTFSTPVAVTPEPLNLDWGPDARARIAIDPQGDIVVTFAIFQDKNFNGRAFFARSSDNGQTWTERDLPTPPNGGVDIACDIAVQKNGTVHVVIETETCDDVECFDEWLYYTKSTNGGLTWSTPKLVADTNFASFSANSCPLAQDGRCIIGLGSIDVDNSGGPCNGTVYVTYADHAANGLGTVHHVAIPRNSWRVRALSRKQPSMRLVTSSVPMVAEFALL